eukprot:539127-Pelagomonas_calceolata.AAC.1
MAETAIMLFKAFSRCEEYCHKLASTERLWPRAFAHASNSETLQVLKVDLHFADRDDFCWSAHVSKAFSGMHNGDVGFEVQTAEGLDSSGCPQSLIGEQESSDLPSLVRTTIELDGMHTLWCHIIFIQGSG